MEGCKEGWYGASRIKAVLVDDGPLVQARDVYYSPLSATWWAGLSGPWGLGSACRWARWASGSV